MISRNEPHLGASCRQEIKKIHGMKKASLLCFLHYMQKSKYEMQKTAVISRYMLEKPWRRAAQTQASQGGEGVRVCGGWESIRTKMGL